MLHLKTDAELRFFVENPTYYQAELVAAARQELRRRQPISPRPPATPSTEPAAAPPAPEAASPVETDSYAAAPRRGAAWVLPASVAGVLLLAGLGFWGKARQHSTPPVAQSAARPPAPPAPLETAISAPPLPTFDAEAYVDRALTKVPAREKANEQHVAQYKALGQRFWAAQQPSAYLMQQVQQGKPNPVFAAQASLVLGLWHDFDRALIYSYDFGPVMGDHFSRMKKIAELQRASLTELANAAAAHRPLHLTDAQLVEGQQALPELLAPLQPSPGKATHL